MRNYKNNKVSFELQNGAGVGFERHQWWQSSTAPLTVERKVTFESDLETVETVSLCFEDEASVFVLRHYSDCNGYVESSCDCISLFRNQDGELDYIVNGGRCETNAFSVE